MKTFLVFRYLQCDFATILHYTFTTILHDTMLDKLKALLKTKLPDKAADIDTLTDAEIKALIPELSAGQPQVGQTHGSAPTQNVPAGSPDIQAIIKQAIEPFMAEVASVKTLLGEERTKREAAEKSLAEKMKADQSSKIKTTLDKAIAEGRIPAKNEEAIKKWTARLEQNFDDQLEVLNALPGKANAHVQKPSPANGDNAQGGSGSGFNQNGQSVVAQLRANAIEAFKNS
jgi:hypothetical protein